MFENTDKTNVLLVKRDAATNEDKFYRVSVEARADSSGMAWGVARHWGRTGTAGQTKFVEYHSEAAARAAATKLVAAKVRFKGYTVERDAAHELTRSMTKMSIARREFKRLREHRQIATGDGLRYDLSRVTRAMHRLASQRFGAMKSAQDLVDNAMSQRFGETDGHLVAEMWGRLYEPAAAHVDEPAGTAGERVRDAIHEQLDALPEWQKIQDRCRRDAMLASVTARHLAEHVIADLIADFPEPEQNDDSGGEDGAAQDGAEGTGENASSAAHGALSAQSAAEMRAKLARALQSAQNAADEADAARAFAWGSDSGDAARDADPSESLALAQNLASDSRLRELLDRVGRMLKAFRDAELSEHGIGQTPFSVTPDAELRRLLPMERIRLAMPETRALTMYRYLQRQTMCYDVRSREPKEYGPFAVCLDVSGSMAGEPLMEAKAFAIAALTMAVENDRPISLVTFNGAANEVAIDDMRTPPGRMRAVRDIASIGSYGGTNFDAALGVAIGCMARQCDTASAADVILITDGDGQFDERRWSAVFENEHRLHHIQIGNHDPVALKRVASQTLSVRTGELDTAATLAVVATRPQ